MNLSAEYQRYHSLDLIRGIAVLAILVVNIWAFAMPFAAYANPPIYGDFGGANFAVWFVSYVLVQEKFITIFSMLFGAGVALFADHARAKGRAVMPLHYRRMLALLFIGLLHAYAFWAGDILTAYALIGMVLYWFLGRSNRSVLIIAFSLIVLSVLLILAFAVSAPKMPAADLAEMQNFWAPAADQLQREIANYQAGWLQQLDTRVPQTFQMQTMVLSFYSIRLLGQMLLGVYLYRSGFLTGAWQRRHYLWVAVFGLVSGLLLAFNGAMSHVAGGFSFEHAMGFGQLWNNIGSLLMAFGYLALFVLWSQSEFAAGLRTALERAGRMGFTLYLGSTLICTTLFYGHGFGLFGRLDRIALFAIVVVIWLVLVGFANRWLQTHQQGPMEQFWRFCTYGRRGSLPAAMPAEPSQP